MDAFVTRKRRISHDDSRSASAASSPPPKKVATVSVTIDVDGPDPSLDVQRKTTPEKKLAESTLPTSSPGLDDQLLDQKGNQQQQQQQQQQDQKCSTPLRVHRVASPFRLTRIRDLPARDNVDAVGLRDLIGDPLVCELWNFNFLHDIAFLLGHLDEDVVESVDVHMVHGFWKHEDERRRRLTDEAAAHPNNNNIHLHTAPMPEMFGTHHSKIMVLFRRDDTAQIIVATANSISIDWTNLTNAVWISPRLPRRTCPEEEEAAAAAAQTIYVDEPTLAQRPPGARFQRDFLRYLQAYDAKKQTCTPLVRRLESHDFSAIRARFIASVPGRHRAKPTLSQTTPLWGWPALRHALQSVPITRLPPSDKTAPKKRILPPSIVTQISSIATLGAKDTWLKSTMFSTLATCPSSTTTSTKSASSSPADSVSSFFQRSSSSSSSSPSPWGKAPQFHIVFPTAEEIRQSLNGYDSGASIHTKTQSNQQAQQLLYQLPYLRHWAGSLAAKSDYRRQRDGGRDRAAPHIKTYIRYAERELVDPDHDHDRRNNDGPVVDWALLTSANLSKQAWGEAANASGEVRIASWEAGVLVWPELLAPEQHCVMEATWKQDVPAAVDVGLNIDLTESEGEGKDVMEKTGNESTTPGTGTAVEPSSVDTESLTKIGLRVPYSWPLCPYARKDIPWVATLPHTQPDWKGERWA